MNTNLTNSMKEIFYLRKKYHSPVAWYYEKTIFLGD